LVPVTPITVMLTAGIAIKTGSNHTGLIAQCWLYHKNGTAAAEEFPVFYRYGHRTIFYGRIDKPVPIALLPLDGQEEKTRHYFAAVQRNAADHTVSNRNTIGKEG
jgi:hypothetical protein